MKIKKLLRGGDYVAASDNTRVERPQTFPQRPMRTAKSFTDIQNYENEINKKTDEEIIHHYYTSKDIDKNYIIDNKKVDSLGVYNRGKLLGRWKAAHGKNKELDDMTVTHTLPDGSIVDGAGNLSTPAGFYYSRYYNSHYHNAPNYIRYAPYMVQKGTKGGIPSSIHARTKLDDKTVTNGCTGMECKSLREMDQIVPRNEYVDTYILPVEEGNKFFLRNGAVLFKSNDTSLTPAYNTIVKTPISEFTYDSPWNLQPNLKKTTNDFMNSLIKNKESLQTDLGINNDTYINLSKMAYGILGAESTFGVEHSAPGNFVRAATKALDIRETSPDIKSKYHTYHVNGDNNSVGLTLMRLKNLSENSKKLLEKYNITKDDLVNNPEKAAVATLIHLGDLFKTTGRNYDKVLKNWNNGKYYAENVKKYSDTVEAYQKYKRGGLITK